jgi:pimeloyl-ACP methyl ester carboxylesterase
MYYEIHGEGDPLVLIHGGGSTIETSFGRVIPRLSQGRKLIALELQAHGRTGDRPAPLSFAQDADDVAALLRHLGIAKADILGFSNGGQTALEFGLRHPGMARKLILASIFYSKAAAPDSFWEIFNHVTLDSMPRVLKEAFLAVNPDPEALQRSFDRDVQRMRTFAGWSDDQLRSLACPVLVINGNQDVGSLEHAVAMTRLFPKAELAVFPGGHGTYLGTLESVEDGKLPRFNATELIEGFLSAAF